VADCHAAIIARELGVPAVVGTGDATSTIKSGEVVTVSCAEGDSGRVYRGEVGFHVDRSDVGDLARPHTKIMINLGNPDLAFKTSFLPNDGVGLARMEFIISESIRAHPCSAAPEKVSDPQVRAELAELTRTTPMVSTSSSSACPRDWHHRRGVLAEAGRRSHVGLQVERVREPLGWKRLRTH